MPDPAWTGVRMLACAVMMLLVATVLAGCSDVVPLPTACDMGICPAGALGSDVDPPPGAVPALTFSEQIGSVRSPVRLDDGWAFLTTRVGSFIEVAFDDGTWLTLSPPPATVFGLIDEVDGRIWALAGDLHDPRSGHVVAWTPGEVAQVWPLPELTYPFRFAGMLREGMLVAADDGQAILGDAVEHLDLGVPKERVAAAGQVIMTAEGPTEMPRLSLRDRVSGSMHTLPPTLHRITHVWANGGQFGVTTVHAFQGEDVVEVMHVDRATHNISFVLDGTAPRFFGSLVYLVSQEPGLNPDIRVVNRDNGLFASVGFLEAGRTATDWDTDGFSVWWLGTPRIDHRFDGAGNPTAYPTVLWRRS